MNLLNRSIFKGMKDSITNHMESVRAIFAQYVKETNEARETAKKFKDESEYYAEKAQIASDKARSALMHEYKAFRTSLKADASNMKKSLQTYLAEPINQDFITKLKVYSDFGIKLTRTEIDSLLALNEGNPTGLRALAHVIEATHTPWKLNYHDISSLEEDIHKVERLSAHALYTPMEYSIQASEILKNTKAISVREDNSTYESGKTYSSIDLMIERQIVSGFLDDDIDQMEQAWIADVTTPAISRASEEERKNLNDVNDQLRKAGIDERYIDNIEDVDSTTSVESDPTTTVIEGLRQGKNNTSYREAIGEYIK